MKILKLTEMLTILLLLFIGCTENIIPKDDGSESNDLEVTLSSVPANYSHSYLVIFDNIDSMNIYAIDTGSATDNEVLKVNLTHYSESNFSLFVVISNENWNPATGQEPPTDARFFYKKNIIDKKAKITANTWQTLEEISNGGGEDTTTVKKVTGVSAAVGSNSVGDKGIWVKYTPLSGYVTYYSYYAKGATVSTSSNITSPGVISGDSIFIGDYFEDDSTYTIAVVGEMGTDKSMLSDPYTFIYKATGLVDDTSGTTDTTDTTDTTIVKVENLIVTISKADTSLTLSWDSIGGNSNMFMVYYRIVGAASYSSTTVVDGKPLCQFVAKYQGTGSRVLELDSTYQFYVKSISPSALSDTITSKFTVVSDSNTAPKIDSTVLTTAIVGIQYNDTIKATDSEGDVIKYSLLTKPDWMTMSDNAIAWTPESIGTYVVEVEADDNNNGYDTLKWNIIVTDFDTLLIKQNDSLKSIISDERFKYFKFFGQKDNPCTLTTTGESDTQMELYSPNGDSIGFNEDISINFGQLNSQIIFTPDSSDTFYIGVAKSEHTKGFDTTVIHYSAKVIDTTVGTAPSLFTLGNWKIAEGDDNYNTNYIDSGEIAPILVKGPYSDSATSISFQFDVLDNMQIGEFDSIKVVYESSSDLFLAFNAEADTGYEFALFSASLDSASTSNSVVLTASQLNASKYPTGDNGLTVSKSTTLKIENYGDLPAGFTFKIYDIYIYGHKGVRSVVSVRSSRNSTDIKAIRDAEEILKSR